MSACVLAAAVALGSSSAANAEDMSSAAPVQDEATLIDSAKLVDRVRSDLAAVGVAVPGVGPEFTEAVERAASSVLPGTRSPSMNEDPTAPDAPATTAEASPGPSAGLPQSSGGAATPAEVDPAQDPSYVWPNDLSSRVLAGKPQEQWVLNWGDVLCKQGVATGHDCATAWLTSEEVVRDGG